MRSCLVATALARVMGFADRDTRAVYYAALLRSVGCTATSHEYAALYGDDMAVRGRGDMIDARAPREIFPSGAPHAPQGREGHRGLAVRRRRRRRRSVLVLIVRFCIQCVPRRSERPQPEPGVPACSRCCHRVRRPPPLPPRAETMQIRSVAPDWPGPSVDCPQATSGSQETSGSGSVRVAWAGARERPARAPSRTVPPAGERRSPCRPGSGCARRCRDCPGRLSTTCTAPGPAFARTCK